MDNRKVVVRKLKGEFKAKVTCYDYEKKALPVFLRELADRIEHKICIGEKEHE